MPYVFDVLLCLVPLALQWARRPPASLFASVALLNLAALVALLAADLLAPGSVAPASPPAYASYLVHALPRQPQIGAIPFWTVLALITYALARLGALPRPRLTLAAFWMMNGALALNDVLHNLLVWQIESSTGMRIVDHVWIFRLMTRTQWGLFLVFLLGLIAFAGVALVGLWRRRFPAGPR